MVKDVIIPVKVAEARLEVNTLEISFPRNLWLLV
jgi:hypothetical protein